MYNMIWDEKKNTNTITEYEEYIMSHAFEKHFIRTKSV